MAPHSHEYGPFGEVIRQTGPMAKANPIRFSTKYQDDESDLLYYGYRYYKASTGTWLSRDPLLEQGFDSIFGASINKRKNNSEKAHDYFTKLYSIRPSVRQKLEPLVSNFNWDTITIPRDEPHQKEDNLYLFVANDPISNFDLKGLSRYYCVIVCTPDDGPSAGAIAGFYAWWVGSCPDYGKCCQEAGNVFCAAYNGNMDRNSYLFALSLGQFDFERCIMKRTISGSR